MPVQRMEMPLIGLRLRTYIHKCAECPVSREGGSPLVALGIKKEAAHDLTRLVLWGGHITNINGSLKEIAHDVVNAAFSFHAPFASNTLNYIVRRAVASAFTRIDDEPIKRYLEGNVMRRQGEEGSLGCVDALLLRLENPAYPLQEGDTVPLRAGEALDGGAELTYIPGFERRHIPSILSFFNDRRRAALSNMSEPGTIRDLMAEAESAANTGSPLLYFYASKKENGVFRFALAYKKEDAFIVAREENKAAVTG